MMMMTDDDARYQVPLPDMQYAMYIYLMSER